MGEELAGSGYFFEAYSPLHNGSVGAVPVDRSKILSYLSNVNVFPMGFGSDNKTRKTAGANFPQLGFPSVRLVVCDLRSSCPGA